jgi:hypothetical protein
VGGLRFVAGYKSTFVNPCMDFIQEHLQATRGAHSYAFCVSSWNDDPMRTKAEVLELLDELIAQTAPEPENLVLEEPEEVLVG